MKKLIIVLGIVCMAVCFVRGFSSHAFLPNPPKRSIVDGYSLALRALGTATNQFYCVASRVDREWCPVGAWVFTFDENRMSHKVVHVAMEPFNRNGAWGDYGKPWPLTEVREVDDLPHTTNNVPNK
jgi:hypothetical protein